ncbi:MAG: hydroxyacylglutathione hydrolase [Kiritimatiellia bacterium]
MNVRVLKALSDNYIFIIEAPSAVVVIDPAETEPVMRWLRDHQREPTHVLITHYHADHTGGVEALRRAYGMPVYGPAPSPFPVEQVEEGCIDLADELTVEVIDTPGHAFPHAAYYFRERGWLFSGDCLFGAGCGRLRGDAAAVMWSSLQRLAALPDQTSIYFGHEYTLDNLAFAATVEPDNPAIPERRARVQDALRTAEFSVPSTLAEEKATNPFLRAGDMATFAARRRRKDVF